MKKFLVYILFILLTIHSVWANNKESLKLYKKGMNYYINREYEKAIKEWSKALKIDPDNKKIKKAFDLTQKKYYNIQMLFYKGMEYFEKKDYDNAIKYFKSALIENPSNKKIKFYLDLCYTPKIFVSIKDKNKFVSAKNQNLFFKIHIEMAKLNKKNFKNWEFVLSDISGKIIKKIKKTKLSETNLKVVPKIKSKLYEGKATYFIKLNLSDGRSVTSSTNEFIIDNTPPKIALKGDSKFIPEKVYSKDSKAKFSIKVYDDLSGIKKWDFIIYDAKKNNILYKVTDDEITKNIQWDGSKTTGGKIAGGSTVFYKVIAEDKSGNIKETDFHKLEAEILLKHEDRGLVMNLPNIEFDTGKDTLKSISFSILNKVGNILKKYKTAKFEIEGHTDDIGNDKDNLILSEKRALAVYNYLHKKFKITRDRVKITGYGETKPLVPNTSDENRRKNRRVEIIIKTK